MTINIQNLVIIKKKLTDKWKSNSIQLWKDGIIFFSESFNPTCGLNKHKIYNSAHIYIYSLLLCLTKKYNKSKRSDYVPDINTMKYKKKS